MGDCGNGASIRHETAVWTLVELLRWMYGAAVAAGLREEKSECTVERSEGEKTEEEVRACSVCESL